MIYTTYFDNLGSLPSNVIPISICGRAPEWYKGLQYKKLAPKLKFFQVWQKSHDNGYYTEKYQEEVLNWLSPQEVVNDLQALLPQESCEGNISQNRNYHVALICYERPPKFCHRHLVSSWLMDNGILCTEWTRESDEKAGRYRLNNS